MSEPRVSLITGATNGIGTAIAEAMAKDYDELYLVCRSEQKGQKIIDQLKADTGNQNIFPLIGDMAKLADVRSVAEQFLALGKPLQLLVNNAGIVNTSRQLTVDGYEETFAVNHLAYFLLTELLRDRIVASAPARIVSTASEAHAMCKGVNFDDLGFETGYKTFKVYGHSKLCNILWTQELARQLEGTGVAVNCVHPGAVRTGLGTQNGWFGKALTALVAPFFKTPAQGAETSIYLARSAEGGEVSGGYYANSKPKTPRAWARDEAVAKRLWEVSETLVADA